MGSFFIFFLKAVVAMGIFVLTLKLIYHKIKFDIIKFTRGESYEELQSGRPKKYLYSG